jgi:hypothetical protein
MDSKITLRAVVFKSGDFWVGQCLEHDIAAQAKTINELPYQLQRAIVGHVVIAIEHKMEPFENVPPAPARFERMFEKGMKVSPTQEHRFTVQGIPQPEIPDLRIADLIRA